MNRGSEASRRAERPARRRLRGVAVAWLLSAAAATAAGAAGDLLALTDHSCCAKTPVSASVPAAPCQALLPLACCDATTLPAVAPATPDRGDAALALPSAPPRPSLDPRASVVLLRHTDASSPRSSPLSLSVILQV